MSKKGGKKGGKKKDAAPAGPGAAEKIEQRAKDASIALFQQMDKDKIKSLSHDLTLSREDNAKLRLAVEKGQRETHDFVAYFQRELEAKDDMLKKRSETIAELEEKLHRETEVLREDAKTNVSTLEQRQRDMELELRSTIQLLENELKAVDKFRQQKAAMETEIEGLKAEVMAARIQFKEDSDNLERKFVGDKAEMKKDFDLEAVKLQQTAEIEIANGLDAETKRIFAENSSLKEELRFIRDHSATLDSANERLKQEIKSLRLEARVTESTQNVHAKKGHKKENQVRDLTNEIVNLEAHVKEIQQRESAQSTKLISAVNKEKELRAEEEKALRHLLMIKNRELAHVKTHARTILEQRTEVEQFFLDALDQCKAKIEEERKREQRAELAAYRKKMLEARTDKQKPFPKILGHRELSVSGRMTANPATSKLPADPKMKVRLADLTWEDRERVLKMLFQKINGIKSVPVTKLPDHPMTGGGSSNQSYSSTFPPPMGKLPA